MLDPFAAVNFHAFGPDSRCEGVGGMTENAAPPSMSHFRPEKASFAKRSFVPPAGPRGTAAFICAPLSRFPEIYFHQILGMLPGSYEPCRRICRGRSRGCFRMMQQNHDL